MFIVLYMLYIYTYSKSVKLKEHSKLFLWWLKLLRVKTAADDTFYQDVQTGWTLHEVIFKAMLGSVADSQKDRTYFSGGAYESINARNGNQWQSAANEV